MKYHHGNLKEKLIISAYQWIADNGTDGFSLRKIAKLSKVSPTAPYRHFSSKEHLLAAVTQLGFENFLNRISSGKRKNNSIEDIVDIAIRYIDFGTENKNIISLMFDYPIPKSDYPELLLAANAAFSFLENEIEFLYKGDETKNRLNSISIHSYTHGLLNMIQMKQRIDTGRENSNRKLAQSSNFYNSSLMLKPNLKLLLSNFIKSLEF